MGAVGEAPAASPRQADSPYVGLSYFTEDVADLFFGRESERTLIIGNLRAAQLTILYAESGVGKSSLLNAGVAARLRSLAMRSLAERGSAQFIPVVFNSWRDDPVGDLIGEIRRAVEPFVSDAQLELPADRLEGAIEAAAAATGATLLLILDQFEEFLLYGASDGQPSRFADELGRCINRHGLPANFLIAVREDAYAGVGDVLRGKVVNAYANTFNLEHLDRDAGREAIVKPIEHFNQSHSEEPPMEVEPGLVEAVLDGVTTGQVAFDHEAAGVVSQDGALAGGNRIETPYLQLVLSALWERERDAGSRVLRAGTLEELGGAQAIVRSHLERAMDQLSQSERETAVDIFNHLVTPSGTKIVHAIPDLAQYGGREVPEVETLVEKLSSGDQRILRPIPPAPGESAMRVEIFHDVLAPAILAWRNAQDSVRLERERQAAEDRATAERRRARIFRALAVVATALLVLAVVAVILARVETNRAHQAEHLALSRQLAAQATSDLQNGALSRGVLLSLEAYRLSPTSDARTSLIRAMDATSAMVSDFGGHTADVTSVVYTPDGKLIATGGADGSILLQDASTGGVVAALRGHTQAVNSIALSRDGKTLVSGGQDGALIFWSIPDGRQLRVIRQATPINGVDFSHTAAVVAASTPQGIVNLYDATTGRLLRTLKVSRKGVNAVAFSPDGRTLATASDDHTVELWNVVSGAHIRTLSGHSKSVSYVVFAPDGKTLASASQDRSVIIWSATTGARLRTLRGHTDFVNSVAYSPDGAVLASAADDHHVILWNAATGRQLQTLRGHSAQVESVAFSPAAATLASGGDDFQVIVWQAKPPLVKQDLAIGSAVNAVAYSPSGRTLAVGADNGTIGLYESTTGRRLNVLRGHTGAVESLAFSPDGRTLASGSADQTVRLWDVSTGALKRTLRGHSDYVFSVAFSPDGRTLASGSADTTVRLWNATTGAAEFTLHGHTDFVNAVAFSPDSRTLASASSDKSVILWDVASGHRLRTLTGHTAAVQAVAFSPDGRLLASASNDGAVLLSNPSTGARQGAPLAGETGSVLTVGFGGNGTVVGTAGAEQSVFVWDRASGLADVFPGHAGPIQGIAFSPDGRDLASASLDQTVQVIGPVPSTVSYDSVLTRLCGVVRRNLLPTEYAQFLPGQPYHHTCSAASPG